MDLVAIVHMLLVAKILVTIVHIPLAVIVHTPVVLKILVEEVVVVVDIVYTVKVLVQAGRMALVVDRT